MADHKHVQAYQQGGAKSGGSSIPQPGLPTYTEAWALIEAARRMAAASDASSSDASEIKSRNAVRNALRLNWKLWTIFQAEMTVENTSNLPDDVRVNMLTLCKFVDKHTVDALKDPTTGKVAALVEINRNIAAGLLASLESANNASAPAETAGVAGEPEGPDANTRVSSSTLNENI